MRTLDPYTSTRVWCLSWEDPLEKGMATHSRFIAWRMPWTGRVGHDWATIIHTSPPKTALGNCMVGDERAVSKLPSLSLHQQISTVAWLPGYLCVFIVLPGLLTWLQGRCCRDTMEIRTKEALPQGPAFWTPRWAGAHPGGVWFGNGKVWVILVPCRW